jgi:hypothetical protein
MVWKKSDGGRKADNGELEMVMVNGMVVQATSTGSGRRGSGSGYVICMDIIMW